MDNVEADKSTSSEETSQLNRNRSFKSKQLVRSQAIRESQSPPRAISPAQYHSPNVTSTATDPEPRIANTAGVTSDTSSHFSGRSSDVISSSDVKVSDSDDYKKQQVEIQITPGWESNPESEQRMRSRRWLSHTHSESSRDLLSNNPRVACVCGACAACPTCRGRRKRQLCHTKQDSGFVCSDECPDCSDTDQSGGTNHGVMRKSGSLDVDDQTYYCRCPERKEKPKNISLTKNDSEERQEPTGPELVNFIKETLNKNPRDRMALLKIEKELHALVTDTGRCIVRFPVMTSYGRMLVHRCAALFQLSHHLDQTNKTSVLVSKSGTSGGRLPCTSFKEWCVASFPPSPQRHQHQPINTSAHTKSILKRDTHSLDEPGGGALSSNRSKSLEQRERDYERVRRRIFSSDNCAQQDESQWPWLRAGPVKLLTPESGCRNKLLKVQSLETSGPETGGSNWRARGSVSKSHSFGGYATDHQPHRLLSKQGDLASSSWRLSPSSSGYKTLSLRSTDSITPSPTGGASPEPSASERVVWCVSDVSAVPPGAVVIHPQTGRPLTNPDGSVYHFDPANPPLLYDTPNHNDQQKVDQSNEKRRGRLEKQHSFIDNDSECPPEECRNKCCCECRRQDACARNAADKETNTKATSPQTRYDSNPTPYTKEKSNRKSPYESTTNNKLSFEQPTNQKAPEPRHTDTTNQRQVYETQTASQKLERSIEMANQRPVVEVPVNRSAKLTPQESQDIQHYPQAFVPTYRPEEMPSQVGQYVPPEIPMQPTLQAKVTPVPIPDPNIRPVSLTNVMYPTAVAQAYPYQCRVDHTLQPVYQQLVQAPEEPKQITASPHATETTFRIDPSYPYAAVDYSAAACGACVDSASLQHQQRSYSVPYGQVEVPQVLPTYPMSNVILPQPHLQAYPYQEQLGWTGVASAPKIMLPELYPIVSYPQPAYPHYNIMYPQVIPQAYPVCQPMYPVAETKPPEPRRESIPTRHKRSSVPGSSRNTPSQVHQEVAHREEKVPYEDKNEIAAKIQQIKHQMAQLNTRDKDSNREEWRRGSGNGILGNYTGNTAYNGATAAPTGRNSNDESQLSSAARAIVNSIRSMQAKSTYQETRRSDRHDGRSERRRARDDADRSRPDSERPRHDIDRTRQEAAKTPAVAFDPTRTTQLRQPILLRQMTPGTWYRRSPGPVHPVLSTRRANSDARNPRR